MHYKQNIYNILIIFTLTVILLLNNLPNNAYSQVDGSTSGAVPQEWVSILNPIHNQKFGIDEEIAVSGQSSDNSEKDCAVAVIVNSVKPYQKAEPTGPSGTADYSEWKFTLHETYTQLIEGQNKITAKLTCASAPTRWYSVFVTGLPPAGTNRAEDTSTDSKSNNSISPEGQDEGILSGLRSSPDTTDTTTSSPTTTAPTAPSSIPDVTANSNYNGLYVTVRPQKDPVARGDSQNVTISVTDSNSKPISDALITGKLLYPGGKYVKDFSGSTDSTGRFAYSWTIGSNGDLGPLEVVVDVTSSSFGSKSITKSFELIEPTGTSVLTKDNIQPISKPALTNDHSQDSPDANFISASETPIMNDKFDFVVAGDYGCDSGTRNTVNAMEEINPDLVLALGDLSEVNNPNCFFDLFSSVNNAGKLKIALGEQDTDSANEFDSSSRLSQFTSHFGLGDTFYSFNHKNIHFLAMSTGKNTMIPYVIGSPQYDFVESDLAKAASDKNIDWIIVYGYRPFYSSPTTHNAAGNIRDTYTPLFEKYGVDLVITAHNHNYQRTYPLSYNPDNPKNPLVKDTDTSNYHNPDGPVYVTVGTAGVNLYDLLGQAPFVATQFKNTGFLNVDISPSKRVLTASFLSTFDGTDEDKFTISKS